MPQSKCGKVWILPENLFKKFVEESKTWSELIEKCGYNHPTNKKTIIKRIEILSLDISHLPKGQNWAKGIKIDSNIKKYSNNEVFSENCPLKCMRDVKKRLLNDLRWEPICSVCKLKEWLGNLIPLELDHINGNRKDNRLQNLRFLCCNCHAFTDTYKGKNVKNSQPPIKSVCIDCNLKISTGSTRCKSCCQSYLRKVKRPSYTQLLDDKSSMPITKIGEKYGVSDNSIRKWIRLYEKYN